MIYIFTECGSSFGFGHLMRCLALYDEIKKRNVDVLFVINGDADFDSVLKDRNYIVSNWYEKTEGYGTSKDSAIIDSYYMDEKNCRIASEHFWKVLFIDDTSRIEYPKGIIANPAIYADEIEYPKKEGQTYLLGSDYTILRREFCCNQGTERKIKDRITDILIIMGGSDICNITPQIIRILSQVKYQTIDKHIVIGSGFSTQDEIQGMCRASDFKLYYNADAQKLKHLMQICDLAITAAGQTVNELVAMQIPFICIKVIDNQENNIKGLMKLGIITDYFDRQNEKENFDFWLQIQLYKIKKLCEREQFVDAMKKLDVCNGTSRIVSNMLGET